MHTKDGNNKVFHKNIHLRFYRNSVKYGHYGNNFVDNKNVTIRFYLLTNAMIH